MKELNTIEVEQVAGGGLLTSLLSNVVNTVSPIVSPILNVTVPDALNSVATAASTILTAAV